jgi:hypothetical protein
MGKHSRPSRKQPYNSYSGEGPPLLTHHVKGLAIRIERRDGLLYHYSFLYPIVPARLGLLKVFGESYMEGLMRVLVETLSQLLRERIPHRCHGRPPRIPPSLKQLYHRLPSPSVGRFTSFLVCPIN